MQRSSEATTSYSFFVANPAGQNLSNETSLLERRIYRNPKVVLNGATEYSSPIGLARDYNEYSKGLRTSDELMRSSLQHLKPDVQNLRMLGTGDTQTNRLQFPNSYESTCSSNGILSSKGGNDSNLIVDCEIHWEDIQLGEEIGQGTLRILLVRTALVFILLHVICPRRSKFVMVLIRRLHEQNLN